VPMSDDSRREIFRRVLPSDQGAGRSTIAVASRGRGPRERREQPTFFSQRERETADSTIRAAHHAGSAARGARCGLCGAAPGRLLARLLAP
jgi:hypothetical protein